jgi:hypothetical protein
MLSFLKGALRNKLSFRRFRISNLHGISYKIYNFLQLGDGQTPKARKAQGRKRRLFPILIGGDRDHDHDHCPLMIVNLAYRSHLHLYIYPENHGGLHRAQGRATELHLQRRSSTFDV